MVGPKGEVPGGQDRGDLQSEHEITVTPFVGDCPIYLEAGMQLRRKGFAIDSIAFTPHDTPGADIKITGEDATLVVDLVSFIKSIYPTGHTASPDQVSRSISGATALLANTRAKGQVYQV